MFPTHRPRRLRLTQNLRNMVQEHHIQASDLIAPIFVVPGHQIKKPIDSLVGQYHFSVDQAVIEAKEIQALGIPAILVFGIAACKGEAEAYSDNGTTQQAVRAIKQACPELVIITDVCLCGNLEHGHCGPLIQHGQTTTVDNDKTLEILAKIAISHAQAGADIVAPSGMMDGMIQAMRQGLDRAGFSHTSILSYAVKYASSFYGPFRGAFDSSPQQGDRKSYQMNPANSREAIVEAEQDIEQGADMLMVKPGMPYLDIIAKLREKFNQPIVAYQVSGEYAMIKAAAEKNWIDEQRVIEESLLCFKRAGCDLIISYFAKDIIKMTS